MSYHTIIGIKKIYKVTYINLIWYKICSFFFRLSRTPYIRESGRWSSGDHRGGRPHGGAGRVHAAGPTGQKPTDRTRLAHHGGDTGARSVV